MASTDPDLICGVCTKLMIDPYSLPCGHTFCLRPCLLSHMEALTARCIYCHATFDVARLRPNYAVGAKLSLLSSRQQQGRKQEAEDKGEFVGAVVTDAEESNENLLSTIRCSTCRKSVEAKVMGICHHCHCSICLQCREKHRDNFSLVLRVKLNALTHQKDILKARMQQSQGLESSSSAAERKTREGLCAALENAVLELRRAASKSLDAATAKLEVVDATGYEMIGPLVRRTTELFVAVGMTKDVYAAAEKITNLQEAVSKQKSLKGLLDESASIGEMLRHLPPLPITEMRLTDRFTVIDAHLRDINLIVGDGLIPLPRLNLRCDIGKPRDATPSNTTATTSRVKLYVGGLRPNHTDSQLLRHFARYGDVTDCYISRDCKTDESRGYAFVTFRDAANATRALADCPHFIDGGPVSVRPFNLKKEKEKLGISSSAKDGVEKEERKDEGSGISGGPGVNKLRLFVGNLNPLASQQVLRDHFSRYGKVTKVDVILDREGGKPRGIAFVNMSTPTEVEAILDARPHKLNGESIIVRHAYLRASKGAAPLVEHSPSLQTKRLGKRRGRSAYPRSSLLDHSERRSGSK
ncbi:Heterogeneou nuclear ribonucleoprotein A2/B1 [Taenia solium]|eukprot:TsM_000218500 transcript=TsM_000218500 gene=TsM_000218500